MKVSLIRLSNSDVVIGYSYYNKAIKKICIAKFWKEIILN
jgi:hypothetical protein